MSTLPPVSTPTIDPNDPRLTQHEYLYDEWAPVIERDGKYLIADRYSKLEETTKQSILWLWEHCHEGMARRIATCGLRGSVYKVCKMGKRARAHRHTCHCWICKFCGQAKNILHCWLRTRRYEVRSETQRGLELCGPADDAKLEAFATKLAAWLKSRGMPSVRRLAVTATKRNSSIRMVIKTSNLPFAEIRDYWNDLTQQGYSVSPHFESTPSAVLQWMFASTEDILSYCGHTRAMLYDRYYRKHLLRTAGAFYSPIKDAKSMEEEFSEVEGEPTTYSACNCGECDGVMETIPWNMRTVQSVDKIEEQYEYVDWSSCQELFRVKRNERLTAKSETASGVAAQTAAFSPSPPS